MGVLPRLASAAAGEAAAPSLAGGAASGLGGVLDRGGVLPRAVAGCAPVSGLGGALPRAVAGVVTLVFGGGGIFGWFALSQLYFAFCTESKYLLTYLLLYRYVVTYLLT